MSVVIRLPTDEILLYVKGADSSILPYVLECGSSEFAADVKRHMLNVKANRMLNES